MLRRRVLTLVLMAALAAAQGEDTAALTADLESPDLDQRHTAAVALARKGQVNRRVVTVLRDSLGSEEWYTRWQACLVLGSLGPDAKPAVPALLAHLEPQEDIGREAAIALVRISPEDPDVVRALLAHITERTGDRRAVLHALAAVGPRGRNAAQLAIEELLRKDPLAQGAAWEAVRSIDAPLELMIRLLRAEDPAVRRLTCEELVHRGSRAKPAIPALTHLLDDADGRVRASAACALQAAGGGPVGDAVVVFELGESPQGAVVPFRAGKDLLAIVTDPQIGPATLDALARFKPIDAAGAVFRGLMKSGDPSARECAAILLGHVQLNREEAVEILRWALDDGSPDVRAAAKESLARIEAERGK